MINRSLEERINRLEAVEEIENLMSKFEYFHTSGSFESTLDLWALNTPGITAEKANWGQYQGVEGIKKCYIGLENYIWGDRVGFMPLLPLTTPLIEVAGDCKTAKGMWMCTGLQTGLREGKVKPHWAWCKYGIDFIKEDRRWKFWHVRVYGIFHTPYDKCWSESPSTLISSRVFPDELKSDKPSDYWWTYGNNRRTELVPVPPGPYETWDSKSMVMVEQKQVKTIRL